LTDYLLFIDTETSGLPKDWGKPYAAQENWPFCVQIAWIIYTKDGKEIKQENHFINENDFKISSSAISIHGITRPFLKMYGKSRKEVMKMLSADVIKYDPLIIGHFMEFDYRMTGADFFRSAIENPIKKEMTFCTMLATTYMVKNPALKFFRLAELYESLFHIKLHNQHNALADANATAESFFELIKRGEVTDKTIACQQKQAVATALKEKQRGCIFPLLLIVLLTFFILYTL